MAKIVDGDSGFGLGANSVDDPEQLPPGSYIRSMNTVNRGRSVQCRPGYTWMANLPPGNLQGATRFHPIQGGDQIVAAVDGKVYYALEPYKEFKQIPGLQFKKDSPMVYWCETTKSVDRNADLSITFQDSKSVLIIQDGETAPASWDGSASSHILGGINQFKTPVGTSMAWVGDRLWVLNGRRVLVGDIANPHSFFEGQYIGVTGSFILPGDGTGLGIIPSPDSPTLAAFTENSTTIFQAFIRTRETWATTANFQLTIFPNIGCVAPRSIVAHNGLLWWFSAYGLTNLNLASQSRLSGTFQTVDDNMAVSKAFLSDDLTGVAAGSFENYFLASVPYADLYNRHTWVLDTKVPSPANWNSYWTGTRPVEWMSGSFNGMPRIFHVSKDADGVNRLWESFGSERLDNGCPITWSVELRPYTGQDTYTRQFKYVDSGLKQFHFADIFMTELEGDVDVRVDWAGANKGQYQNILSKRISAMRGSMDAAAPLTSTSKSFAMNKQSRKLRTQEQRLTPLEDPAAGNVESDREMWIDTGFHLYLTASGPGAVRTVRTFLEPEAEKPMGKCEDDETGEARGVRFDGASALASTPAEVITLLQPATGLFSATKTVSYSSGSITVSDTATASTGISQAAADKLAASVAQFRAAEKLTRLAAPAPGGIFPVPEPAPVCEECVCA